MYKKTRFRRIRSRDELLGRIAGRRVVVSVSGGKDSVATCLWLRELGVEYEAIFADVGWEHPETYRYIRETLPRYIGPVRELRASMTLPEVCRHKGSFPSRRRQWCTDLLKLRPARAYMRTLGGDVVNAIGIRADESRRRATHPQWSRDRRYIEVWRPILRWPASEVWAIHERHGVPPNPLYAMGVSRVGCWPCVQAGQDVLRLLAGDQSRVAEIRKLERELSERAGVEVTWFGRGGRGGRGLVALPIDAAIEAAQRRP